MIETTGNSEDFPRDMLLGFCGFVLFYNILLNINSKIPMHTEEIEDDLSLDEEEELTDEEELNSDFESDEISESDFESDEKVNEEKSEEEKSEESYENICENCEKAEDID